MSTLSVKSVPQVFWQDKKVITTELLAKLYETEPGSIQVNYFRNADRFTEGKHFFKVSGQELKDLRLTLSKAQISAKARSLYLWTERGAARHAKMLETNQAWDVFEALEDHYFDGKLPRRRRPPRPVALNTIIDRRALHHYSVDLMVERKLSQPTIFQMFGRFAGVRRIDLIPPERIPEVEGFARRFRLRQANEDDQARIEAGRKLLAEDSPQLELVAQS